MRRIGALFVLVALVFGTATSVDAKTKKPRPSATTTTTTTTWPPLPASSTEVSWSACGNGFECGTLSVPVDWRAPLGEQLPLALIRRPAEDPSLRIGALLVNYGGPGQGGVSYLPRTWTRLPAGIRARFDIVSWDPRGTGDSRPIDCVDDAFLDEIMNLPAVPNSPEGLAAVHAFSNTFAQGCAARMGAYASYVGTRNTARDLEAIRRALAEPTLNYLGYSYGTVVGAVYAQMFPTSIRTMVLDGPADWWQPRLEYSYAQAQGFKQALDAFFGWCEAAVSCALRQAGAPRAVLDALIVNTAAEVMPGSYSLNGAVRDGVLTGTTLETGVINLLYDSRSWPTLANALRSAAQDGWGGPLLASADQYYRRSVDGTFSSMVEANAVIGCVDHPETAPPTVVQELADVSRFQAQIPPWGGNWAVAGCRGMPRPAKGAKLGDLRVTNAPPILVVATTGDPATPYSGALTFVARLGSSTLLTFEGTEHTAYGSARSTCVDDIVDTYLVDRAVPAPDTRC